MPSRFMRKFNVPKYIIFVFILTFLHSCDFPDQMDDPLNDTSALEGKWFRIESNNPDNDNMVIEVENAAGVITDRANASSFNVGDVKWNSITATSETLFDYKELGSDRNYYDAQMELADDTTLLISISYTGAGNNQKWLREGSVYVQPAVTTTLDCKINSPTTLVDGPAEVDYLVECVVDITAALTIEAGVVIEFAENAGLGVYDGGSLKMIGETEKNIVLRGEQNVTGYWRGIHIETRSVNNVLNHVQIRNAGSNYVYCCNEKASLFLKGGLIALDHTMIADGGGSGLIVNGEAEFGSLTHITITGHDEYPVMTTANALRYFGDPESDFTGNTQDFIYILKSDLTKETTWKATTVPYMLNGSIMDITAPLTIAAGTIIEVESKGGIGVFDNGSLSVAGNSESPVIIRGKEAVAGYWRGVHMETNSISNKLDYLEIYDAGNNYVYCCNAIAALFFKAGRCAISNLTIGRASEYGIIAKDAFTFTEYANVTIDSELEPLYLAAERVGEIEANGSLSGGASHNFIKLENTDITAAVAFRDQNIPYLVDFVLDITNALTIDAGVEMVFMQNGGLGVYNAGSLTIKGTESQNVVLSGYEAIQGYWRGIHCETNSLANSIDHAQILYAGGNYIYCCNDKAGLFVKSGVFALTNSEISHSGGYGVIVKPGATLTDAGNTFSNNADGNIGSN